MSNYDETNRGAIWGNRNKQKETDRDFQGSINVGGVDYWISGWRRKEGDNPNAPAVRLSLTPKEQVHSQGMQQTQQVMQQAPQQQRQAPQQQRQQQRPQQQQIPEEYDNYSQEQHMVEDFNDDIPF